MVIEAEQVAEAAMAHQGEETEPLQIGHVMGDTGAAVVLAGETYHFRRFTAAGMRDLVAKLDTDAARLLPVYVEGATLGEMPVTAIARSPSASYAAADRNVLSTPPEYATSTLSSSCRMESSCRSFC